MNYLKHFIIPFSGLKAGTYTYAFEIDDRFFEHFEYSEIKKGKVHIGCQLEKQARMMILIFDITGTVRVACDRCADEFDQPLDGRQKLIVKYGPDHHEETDDILIIAESENELDISQFLYEYIHLLIPIRKVHGTDENGHSLCNPEVLRFIREESGDHSVDPRWEALRNLKENSNDNEN
jgi:uncharacterized metal-binding protein YceD (DUF177 family)